MHLFWSSLIYFWQVLGEISPLLVLIISICAIYVAIQSKREARIAAQMNLFYQLLARYSSPEMHGALEIIGELFDVRKADKSVFFEILQQYQKCCKQKDLYGRLVRVKTVTAQNGGKRSVTYFGHSYQETNAARRQVSNFFTYSFDLLAKYKVLDDVYFKDICSINTFKFLYHVIEWLELAINPKYARKTWTGLLEQSGRGDIEYLRSRRPPPTWPEVEQMIQSNQLQSEQ